MKRNLSSLFLSTLTSATAGFVLLSSIPSLANAATLNTQSNQAENKQLIAQSCGNTEIRLTDGQSKSWGRGSSWKTCNGYTFGLQNDGNLVLYSRTAWLWSTNTAGRGHAIALQRDGNVVLYDSNWKPIWATKTVGNSGAFLALQTDGNLVVYNSSGRPLWATNTSRPAASPPTASRPTPPLSSLQISNSKCYFGGVCDGTSGKHNGVDYKAAVGTEVKAICDGVVTSEARTENIAIRNRFTIIKHTNCGGYPVLYGYYGHINASVTAGKSVKQGQTIGYVATYPTNNNHLHFSVSTQWNPRGWGYGVDRGGWFDPTSLFQ